MVDILHLQNNTLRWSNDCRQSRGVSLEATTSCRVRTRLPRIKFTNNKSVGHKIFVFTIKYLCSLMRLPSGGVLMGFCKLRSSCPPAPCTRASHHDPWSSHDTFCNFWAFGRILVFAGSEEARSENNRDLGQNRRQQGACTCTWYNARWMVVLFDWVKYSFLSIYSLWVQFHKFYIPDMKC